MLSSKRYTFLLWGRDSKHTWHRISLSVARVFENMPGRMIAQVAAEVRGRSMGLGLLGGTIGKKSLLSHISKGEGFG